MVKFEVALAKADDLDLLVRHRLSMWTDIAPELKTEIQESEERTRQWISGMLSEDRLIGVIAKTEEGQIAGSGCIWLREEQPRPTTSRLKAPYLMSIYTEKGFRRTGVASLIVKSAIAWCKEHGYDRITLHASEAGKRVYEAFGFKSANEMRLTL
jgi:GNAT superfamily N-acetyltransferase